MRQAENFVKIFKNKRFKTNTYRDPNLKDLENSISEKIGLNVIIKNNKNNKGTITFSYNELELLNKIIDIIKLNY